MDGCLLVKGVLVEDQDVGVRILPGNAAVDIAGSQILDLLFAGLLPPQRPVQQRAPHPASSLIKIMDGCLLVMCVLVEDQDVGARILPDNAAVDIAGSQILDLLFAGLLPPQHPVLQRSSPPCASSQASTTAGCAH